MWRSHRAVQSGVARSTRYHYCVHRGAPHLFSSSFTVRAAATPRRPSDLSMCSDMATLPTRKSASDSQRWMSQAGTASRRRKSSSLGRDICRSLSASLHELQNDLELIPVQPPIWTATSSGGDAVSDDSHVEKRRDIFQQTQAIVRELEERIQDESVRPSTKNSQDVSIVLQNVLQLYSECADDSDDDLLVFRECQRVLDLMERCKLELNSHHCDYAVTIAARSNQWEESSDIYWNFIDPDFSGYKPCTVSVSKPVGLYAVARAAKEKGIPVVERVFDAVLRMCMVSPSDQEKYVLAAGTAIGRAGEWEKLIEYLKTSYEKQPLIAAAMHACLLCDKHDEALDVFDEATELQSAAVEWQWAGTSDVVHPLCRDLAMRALGGSTKSGVSDRAQRFFDEVLEEDELPISVEALYGVVSAFESEGRWENAVDCLFSLLKTPSIQSRIVDGNELNISSDYSARDSPADLADVANLSPVLNRVVRACNSSREFGVALLCIHLMVDLVNSLNVEESAGKDQSLVKSLSPLLQSSPYADDLLAATMTSLCGVGCYKAAQDLYEATLSNTSKNSDLECSRELYQWLSTESSVKVPTSTSHGWQSALQQMQHILSACSEVRAGGRRLSPFDLNLLSSVTASFVRFSTHAAEPEMGIYLGTWVETALGRAGGNHSPGLFDNGLTGIPVTDSYLSAAIAAFGASRRQVDTATDLAELYLVSDSSNTKMEWTLSYQETVRLLLSRSDVSALSRFREAALVRRNPGLVCAAAKGLADNGNWKGVADLYRLALTSGCLSEELSLLAMRAVSADQKTQGKFRILRTVVDEAAKLSGLSPDAWMESKYWTVKGLLGFSSTRRLMWWDDPKTAHLDELELALDVFESRLASGLTPKNQALRVIILAARGFEEGYVPADRTGLPRVPRTVDSWIDIVSRVVEAAESTFLRDDPSFVRDVSIALQNLGCSTACVEYVTQAISRGVQVRQAALDIALEASAGPDCSPLAGADLQMMSERTHL